jgi:precorrin-4/cobalt-precorrin-4 C11-methyltransferase
VAIVARATWPDERQVTGTLGDIVAGAAPLGMERSALVLVGRALAAEGFRDSALYDPDYRRRYRP